MKVTFIAQGKEVYEFIRCPGYPIHKMLIRVCRDNTEARAIANYYKLRKA